MISPLRQTFYQQQDQARAQTTRLLGVFALVVIATVGATMGVVHLITALELKRLPPFPNRFDIVAGALAAAVVLVGALVKRSQLKHGGQTLAHMMGGRVLIPGSVEPEERRLLNVVEEMSLAAGIPVPPVYVLDRELGINAFAAGSNPSNAVIGISKGAVSALNRDELQGVVAHEFSHIFNGDMRLNMDLLGWVAGLTSFSTIGRFLLDLTRGTNRFRTRQKSQADLFFFLIGVGLIAVGFFGSMMAGLVKAAVSRQREYLADATAIQYTRNPSGIGGALLKILRHSFESVILSPVAKDASHFFFAPAVNEHFYNSSTHPPVLERLKRISPELALAASAPRPPSNASSPTVSDSEPGPTSGLTSNLTAEPEVTTTPPRTAPPDSFATANAIAESARKITSISSRLVESARVSTTAPIVVAMILSIEASENRQQVEMELSWYGGGSDFAAQVAEMTTVLYLIGEAQAKALRFTLLELAMPALRLLPAAERIRLLQLAQRLVLANGRISIFEAAALSVLRQALAPQRESRHRLTRPELKIALSVLLSAFAHQDSNPRLRFEAISRLIAEGKDSLQPTFIEQRGLTGERLIAALSALRDGPVALRRFTVAAIEETVGSTQPTSLEAVELLRATILALQ